MGTVAMERDPTIRKTGAPRAYERPRGGQARAISELMPQIGRTAFRKFGFVQSSVVTRWPEIVQQACELRAPHMVVHYLRELATAFHAYYSALPFIVDDAGLRNARLALIVAARQVLRNALDLLGVSAPESM